MRSLLVTAALLLSSQKKEKRATNYSCALDGAYLGRLLPVFVAFVKPRVLVRQINRLAVDDEVLDARAVFEQVAISYDYVGDLADFEAADELVESENLRGIKRDAFERFFFRQTEGRRSACVIRQQANVRGAV